MKQVARGTDDQAAVAGCLLLADGVAMKRGRCLILGGRKYPNPLRCAGHGQWLSPPRPTTPRTKSTCDGRDTRRGFGTFAGPAATPMLPKLRRWAWCSRSGSPLPGPRRQAAPNRPWRAGGGDHRGGLSALGRACASPMAPWRADPRRLPLRVLLASQCVATADPRLDRAYGPRSVPSVRLPRQGRAQRPDRDSGAVV
jgi:hypothetical protein